MSLQLYFEIVEKMMRGLLQNNTISVSYVPYHTFCIYDNSRQRVRQSRCASMSGDAIIQKLNKLDL